MTDHVGPIDHLDLGGGDPDRKPRSRTRRRAIEVGAGLSVLGLVAGGVWAWGAWFDQGPQPAEILPGNTLAYAAIDLDPSGRQQVEALDFLREFPELLGGDGGQDAVRETLFDEIRSGSCKNLDYDDDIKPWVGDRAAIAMVDKGGLTPVAVLQVRDGDRAIRALESVAACARNDDAEFGYAVSGDWAVLAESERTAKELLAAGKKNPLSDDKDFRHWTGAAGDPGIVTLYVAPEAGPRIAEDENAFFFMMVPGGALSFDPLRSLLSVAMFSVSMPDFGESEFSGEEFAGEEFGGEYEEPTEAEIAQMEADWEKFDKLETDLREDGLTEAEAEQLESLMREQMRAQLERDGLKPEAIDDIIRDMPEEAFEVGNEVVGPDGEDIEGMTDEELEAMEDDYPMPELPEGMRKSLESFSGLGGAVRFADGDLVVEIVTDRIEGSMGTLVGGDSATDLLADLPDDTAVAYGGALRDGWVQALVDSMVGAFWGMSETTPEEAIADLEKATGLKVPGEVEALAGEAFAIALGKDLAPGFTPDGELAELPITVRVKGDPVAIEASLGKIRATLPKADAKYLVSKRVGDDVLVGTSTAYVESLASGGGLLESDAFKNVAPDADGASSVLFVNFDAGNWLAKMLDGDDRKNAEALDSLGLTVRVTDETEHSVLRLTTDD